MTFTPNATNWPTGSLQVCESVQSIATKLAIFNHVKALHYERVVRESSTAVIARLLREPRRRVQAAIEFPPWVSRMATLLEQSVIFSEIEESRARPALSSKYCSRCLEAFYHSWIHDLSWLDYCFVHRKTRLTMLPHSYPLSESQALVRHLHTIWTATFGTYLRSPENFSAVLADATNSKRSRAAKALGRLFSPPQHQQRTLGPTDSHQLLGFANSRGPMEQCMSDASAPVGRGKQSGRMSYCLSPEDVKESAHAQAKDKTRAWLDDNEAGAPDRYARVKVGVIAYASASTRAALACGVVSSIRQTTDNWLNLNHEEHRHLRYIGEVEFAAYSAPPKFFRHLAHVLATGTSRPERILLEDFIARLSHGHEACLGALRERYESWDHLAIGPDRREDSHYIAFHLREHGICARLLTLDLVTRMLSPHFLCAGLRYEVAERRASHGRLGWVHAALRPHGLFGSHEWRPYGWAFQSRLVFPQSSAVANFAHTLRDLEWAFLRRETRGYGPQRVNAALDQVVLDQQLVIVASAARDEDPLDGQLCRTYYSPNGADAPDWNALAARQPSHALDASRVLDEVRLKDIIPPWRDLLDGRGPVARTSWDLILKSD